MKLTTAAVIIITIIVIKIIKIIMRIRDATGNRDKHVMLM